MLLLELSLNQKVFMNIELTDEAIEQGKQIRFEYYRYRTDKKLHMTRAHHASPYQPILHNQIIDRFGKDIRIDGYGYKQIKVTVKVNPSAMEHRALQYAGYVTVTSPRSLAESIKSRLQKAVEKYKV